MTVFKQSGVVCGDGVVGSNQGVPLFQVLFVDCLDHYYLDVLINFDKSNYYYEI